MKAFLFTIAFSQLLFFSLRAQDKGVTKANYEAAKQGITNMLAGKEPLSYERSIFLIENAWWDGEIEYTYFQDFVSNGVQKIKALREQSTRRIPKAPPNTFFDALREKKNADMGFAENARTNYAIYAYMTDTTAYVDSNARDGISYHLPFHYSTSDPMGTLDWQNTQVGNLFFKGRGNCFALASLFKIYADRLGTDAVICTAPSHVYIQHKDENGTNFNVEIASKAFPGTGTMSTLTYTKQDAIRSGISLRDLDLKQSVTLCLVYLAKSYEYKMHIRMDDGFMMECADLALKYDSLNLNAMLLKAEIEENDFLSTGKTVAQLQQNGAFKQYELLLGKLYTLGYREMPLQMKNVLIKGWTHDTVTKLANKNYLLPHSNSGASPTRYASLSWGLFDEDIADKPTERYDRTLFDTKLHKVKGFAKEETLYNDYNFDPVLFALNVDPLAAKYPDISPYAFCNNNPILLHDADGREPVKPYVGTSAQFRALLDNSPSHVGQYTGAQAGNYLRNLGNTEFSWKQMRPLPTETGYFNKKASRYIYTEKGGWLDMAHFMFYAGKASDYKQQKEQAEQVMKGDGFKYMKDGTQMGIISKATMDPVNEAVKDGYHQELTDKFAAKYSAYSYEDLPSDKLGAEFGANYFDPKSKLTFGEQLENYLNGLGATSPQNAPNYNSLPATEPTDKPSRTNTSTTPVYTKTNP